MCFIGLAVIKGIVLGRSVEALSNIWASQIETGLSDALVLLVLVSSFIDKSKMQMKLSLLSDRQIWKEGTGDCGQEKSESHTPAIKMDRWQENGGFQLGLSNDCNHTEASM